jgi:predicted permease
MLATLFGIFVRVILPVAVIVIIGYVAGRALRIDQRPLARVSLYVLVPCMVFTGMARTAISPVELGQIFAFVALSVLTMWPVSLLAARVLGLNKAETSAFLLGTLLTNGVNVGFPVLTLAFGAAGLERGVIYAVGLQVSFQTLGVYLAAGGRVSAIQAVKKVVRVPGVYALALGLICNWTAWPVPEWLFDPIKMVGDSLVPLLLIVLGIQLTEVNFRGHLKVAAVATALRLVASVALAALICQGLGIGGVARQAMITEAGMPSAIFGLVLAQEFDCEPRMLTAIIFVSTILCMFSLTVLLAIV